MIFDISGTYIPCNGTGCMVQFNHKSEPGRITRKWLGWGNKGGESRKAARERPKEESSILDFLF
ncbi:hypothetical protein [Thiolapillus sp.]|uniref:hypothetical protein n=1 Tax=Thiolapillus sp. TaxID=2017437 RepID=UPI0025F3BC5C|nr:hypothetical protein [Thiolapillus sp.]